MLTFMMMVLVFTVITIMMIMIMIMIFSDNSAKLLKKLCVTLLCRFQVYEQFSTIPRTFKM